MTLSTIWLAAESEVSTIKFFLTVFKEDDPDGKNIICESKEDAIARAEHAVKNVLHKGEKIMLCYGDFDEADNHLKGGVFYYVDTWEAWSSGRKTKGMNWHKLPDTYSCKEKGALLEILTPYCLIN